MTAVCWSREVVAQCGSDNSTSNGTSSDTNVTCAESRATSVPCAANCTQPVESTSRLLPGVTVASNNETFEKPLSTTAHFSPSPFLGVIPERPSSLVIGEVFQDTVAPQAVTPRQKTLAFPSNRPVQEYAHPRDTYREYQRPSVEIHVEPAGTDYDRPEYDNSGRPYGSPDVDLTVPTGYGSPEGLSPKPDGVRTHSGTAGGVYPNHVEFNGYPDGRPKQPYYEGFENVKNLLKPIKSPPPYQFEPSFGAEKPIQEDNGELNHYSLAYPPVGAEGTPAAYNQYLTEHGKDSGSKWKSVLRFVATVLPFGLLLAALSPNILVISPADESEGTAKTPSGHRSLQQGSLGPCGLRKLCEALSTSPRDFEVFLKAAKQGSTPELKDIIKKAEEKDCSSLGCLELKPTQPTVR
ncbi:uncharacterized protein [Halyomorpha halys]|uniref:uncharacterized protein n=1 Tax=Halyomorpha halys TaxID=286706 RepID=UPI0006D4F28E|nr:uncharacterized protein LOC106679874 [Halyomorpha halys]